VALFGYAREEVIGHPLSAFQSPGSDRYAEADRSKLMAEGEVRDLERRFLRRDGGVVDALVSARVDRRREGTRIICVLIDVTARRRAEEALRRSEADLRQAKKMEAIGQLTGGIAHDFNNMLTAVMGNLELIRGRSCDERPDLAQFAADALDAAGKAAGLTAQLLSFSRRRRLDPKPLDPVEVIGGLRTLLAQTAGERITLRIETEEGGGLCFADRNQLESAILNLAINARDAIAGAGVITISLRTEQVAARPDGSPPAGNYVRIAVKDDGCGMPEEVLRRAFEPFFTTKEAGQGTGLGLAQIYGFAHQSGGTVTIESEPGQGTEVVILMPRIGTATPEFDPEPRDAAADAPSARGETVLLVEDDTLVRAALAAMLADLGYRVLEAEDADAGLSILAGASVDALLTDLTMPGRLDGLELAEVAETRRPGLPIVLVTGYPGMLRGRRLREGTQFLQKPCSRVQLAAALRRALDGVGKPVPA
jgi:PAS domain S-box-containing protein